MADIQPSLDEMFEQALAQDAQASVPERPASATEEAPYGFTRDAQTGELRPKLKAGRPRKPPGIEQLKAEREKEPLETDPVVDGSTGDRPPEKPRRSHHKKPPADAARTAPAPGQPGQRTTPQFREGQIAGGMNRLYRRAGRIIKVFDPVVGEAFIEATRKEDEADITVGEAWEELARGNPRIRKFLLKMISGGAWGQLVMAHAPILLAVLMKDSIRQFIPFAKVAEAYLGSEEEQANGEGPPPGSPFEGLRPEDMAQMQQAAEAFAVQMMSRQTGQPPRSPVAPVPDLP